MTLDGNRSNITYDANGNMLSDGTRTLTWDSANRLASVTAGAVTTTFAYDPDGARVKKATPAAGGRPAAVTLYAGPMSRSTPATARSIPATTLAIRMPT